MSAEPAKAPKKKLRLETEVDPVPTLVVIRTEYTLDPNNPGTYAFERPAARLSR